MQLISFNFSRKTIGLSSKRTSKTPPPRLSFHPNDNTGTIIISQEDFIGFLEIMGNRYEFIELYD